MEFQNSFNHYPNTMINLCAISYNDLSTIITDVSAYDPNLEVVWGPAQLTTNWPFDQSYSRAFIARNVVTDEYTLVIRGTNPLSFTSWAEEDFDIIRMRGLDEIARGLPTDITVSSGTFNGINFLLQLLDNGPDGKRTGLTLLEFLLQKQPRMLFITGHSLGGTLTPAMYVVLHQLMRNANKLPRVYFPFSFAGLTPGGDDFNNYLSLLMAPYSQEWRYYNSLDVAPCLFGERHRLFHIYDPHTSPNVLEEAAIDLLFIEAFERYTQPGFGGYALVGTFDPNYDSFASQGAQQHHCTPTYVDLVKKYFPI